MNVKFQKYDFYFDSFGATKYIVNTTLTCNSNWYRTRRCDNIVNCSECVAVNPQFKSDGPVCIQQKILFNDMHCLSNFINIAYNCTLVQNKQNHLYTVCD